MHETQNIPLVELEQKHPIPANRTFYPLPGIILGAPILLYLFMYVPIIAFKARDNIDEFSFPSALITIGIIVAIIYYGSFKIQSGNSKRLAKRFVVVVSVLMFVGLYSFGKGQPHLYYRCNDGQATSPYRESVDSPALVASTMRMLGCRNLEMHVALWQDERHINRGVIAYASVIGVGFLTAAAASLFSLRATKWVLGILGGIEVIAIAAYFVKLY
jgi:hypothetical protein